MKPRCSMQSSDLECLKDAVHSGAVVLNHVERWQLRATASVRDGIVAPQPAEWREFDVRAKLTINAPVRRSGRAEVCTTPLRLQTTVVALGTESGPRTAVRYAGPCWEWEAAAFGCCRRQIQSPVLRHALADCSIVGTTTCVTRAKRMICTTPPRTPTFFCGKSAPIARHRPRRQRHPVCACGSRPPRMTLVARTRHHWSIMRGQMRKRCGHRTSISTRPLRRLQPCAALIEALGPRGATRPQACFRMPCARDDVPQSGCGRGSDEESLRTQPGHAASMAVVGRLDAMLPRNTLPEPERIFRCQRALWQSRTRWGCGSGRAFRRHDLVERGRIPPRSGVGH